MSLMKIFGKRPESNGLGRKPNESFADYRLRRAAAQAHKPRARVLWDSSPGPNGKGRSYVRARDGGLH